MSASTSTNETPVPGTRYKAKRGPSGWMEFDLHQNRKQQGLESHNDTEAYPVLAGPTASKSLINKNGTSLGKSFTSVVAPVDFVPLIDAEARHPQIPSPSNDSYQRAQNNGLAVSLKDYQKLNEFRPWVSEGLIEDILAGVNYDMDEALSLLEAMFITENKDIDAKIVEDNEDDLNPFDSQGASLVEKPDMIFVTREACSMAPLDTAKALPIEPEWEEDDVYLIHRKDAIKAIRSVSRQSKAANDAYIRGDHVSAHHYSRLAQEGWIAAEKLNSKAAKEILMVRNHNNDPWTLDLHGLHAVEAVDALREHLQNVEYLVSLDRANKEPGFVAMSVKSTSGLKVENSLGCGFSTRPRTMLLQVITGSGKHSKGVAALPSAVRNFLMENGYHFDESRPGTFMVRPKFRKQ